MRIQICGCGIHAVIGLLVCLGLPVVHAEPAVAMSLLVDLAASSFDAIASNWDNTATSGMVSLANGDFVTAGVADTRPALGFVGPLGTPAVVFNVSTTGAAQYLNGSMASPWFSGLFGASDWTIEYWGWTAGFAAYVNNAENPVMMWSPRPAAACTSAYVGMGNDPSFGAGGHYDCDIAYGATTDGNNGRGPPTAVVPGHGYGPSTNQWHHIVVTYTGAPSLYGGAVNETVYVDGQQSTQVVGRALNIHPVSPLHARAV